MEKNSVSSQSLEADDNLAYSPNTTKQTHQISDIFTDIPGIAWELWGSPDSGGKRVDFINKYAETMLGYTSDEWLSVPDFWLSIIHPDDQEEVKRIAVEKFALRQNYTHEFRWIAKDKSIVWGEAHTVIKYDKDGQSNGLKGFIVDITKRKQFEEERVQLLAELKIQKIRLQHAFDNAPSFIVTLRGREMVFELANPAYYQLVGQRELIGKKLQEVFPELESQGVIKILNDVFDTGIPFINNELEFYLATPGGLSQKQHYVNVIYSPLRESDGSISGILSYGVDVTEQVLSRIKIEESEQRYQHLFKSNPIPMWVFDLETLIFLSVNDAAIKHYGYSEEEFLKMSILDIRQPEEIPRIIEHLKTNYSGVTKSHIFKHQKKDGTLIDMEIVSNRIIYNGRKAELVLGHDTTERRNAEIALRQAEQNYRHLVESSPGIVYLNEPAPPYLPIYISPNIKEFGFTPEEYYANPSLLRDIIHSEDQERVIKEFNAAVAHALDSELKYRIIARDGSIHWWKNKARFVFDEQGNRTGWQGIILDITATKELEEQLRQSQKLESVGLLAGGIAHDFNNMLTAINGYSDLTLRQLAKDDPLRHNIEEIKKAGQHSADLTNQLLAFSRQQILKPKVSNINEITADTIKLLQRLIGEDVQLITSLNPRVGQVLVDPGQFSQIIMNIAINARDAMPQGGNLTIETANVFLDKDYTDPHIDILTGAYVMTSISDTGVGMSEETKLHIFDPFFTTKEMGHGTGLGLATVYGIVKQSGGAIDVTSEEGVGTSFKIYLPRVVAEIERVEPIHISTEMAAGSETILLVEDEKMVRNLSKMILEECGYTVIEAENGLKALELCEQEDCHFDLLMTDVVMPQMSGRELAEKLKEKVPNLLFLFTSGYTDDAVVRHGIIESNTNFIQKPFTVGELSNKIREIFDNAK